MMEITFKLKKLHRTIAMTALFLLAMSPVFGQQPKPNPEREAYFGETHVHTGWSFDAYIFGNTKTGPAPNDLIYLAMRLYWPKTEAPSILPPGEGTWQPPTIVKVM